LNGADRLVWRILTAVVFYVTEIPRRIRFVMHLAGSIVILHVFLERISLRIHILRGKATMSSIRERLGRVL
jgi:phage-related protein